MSKTFRPNEPDQIFLMPASMQDWLPGGHLAYFISDVVDHIDLSVIMERYTGEERGYPPYHPQMMVKVLLYAYCIGVVSSRKIEKRLCEDIAFRVLAANNTPDFRTISDFRKDHLKALAGLFLQVLKLCQKAGLVKLGHVALDGTKVKANASKHKAMSYKRMKEEEARLEIEIKEMLQKAEVVDEEEDQRYGKDRRGDELPKELAFRESRLRRYGKPGKHWRKRQSVKLRQPLQKTRNIPACRMIRHRGISPTPSHISCRPREVSISSRPITPRPLSIVLTRSLWQPRLRTTPQTENRPNR